ncbi:hypothetical protein INT45_002778 [Circinella minor]|uniref:Transposase domain-containing protein n=1 Tax=Circinella minor TaxID=1195481 RepID=A0A8H7RS95_9FUNG|nr:hypothetical protein INT45_002778 [Circinella minor]
MPDRIVLQKCSSCRWIFKGTRLELDAHETTCIKNKLNRLRNNSQLCSKPESSKTANVSEVRQYFRVHKFNIKANCIVGKLENNEAVPSCQQNDDVDIIDCNTYKKISTAPHKNKIPVPLLDSTNITDEAIPPSAPQQQTANISSSYHMTTINNNSHVTSAAKVIDVRQRYARDDAHIKASLDMYEITIRHGGTQELFDKMIARFNQYIDKQLPPLYSFHKSRQALRESYGIQPNEYHICKNGCMMFKDENIALECDECHEPRYQDADSLTPKRTMVQLPLKEQLALFVNDDRVRKMLKHRANWVSSATVKKSIFDGAVYKELLNNNIFTEEIDIALALYVDDFEGFKRGKNTMSICHIVILNLPEDIRYEDANMIQIFVAPGPNKPKDLPSFLDPVLQELEELCKHGMVVETKGQKIPLKAHLLFVGGDVPGVAKVAGHIGHQSYKGCRFCTIKGVHQEGRMTFPPVLKSKTRHESISTNIGRNNEIGQSAASPFANLSTFHGATFFPIDIMHLMKGVGEQLWNMIKGVYGKDDCPLYLLNVEQKQIGSRIASSRHLTPSSFSGDCGDVSLQTGFYRAVDWIHFVLSREIDENGVSCLRHAVKSWTNWLSKQVKNRKLSAAVFTINEHYLTHLCKTIEQDGPLIYLAAFSMEREIGIIKKRIRSHRHPGMNAGNSLVDLAAVRKRKRSELNDDNEDDSAENDNDSDIDKTDEHLPKRKTEPKKAVVVSRDDNSAQIWGPFAVDTIEALNCQKQLRHFWAWRKCTYNGVNIDFDEYIEIASRLYKDGVTYGGIERESLLRLHIWVDIDKSRKKSSVKPEQRQYFGEVKYFFKHGFVVDEHEGKCEKLLALVELCTLVKGHGPWPYKTDGGSKTYVVIEEESIVGVAGRAKGKDTCEYIYWSKKTPHSKKDNVIDYNLEFIPH